MYIITDNTQVSIYKHIYACVWVRPLLEIFSNYIYSTEKLPISTDVLWVEEKYSFASSSISNQKKKLHRYIFDDITNENLYFNNISMRIIIQKYLNINIIQTNFLTMNNLVFCNFALLLSSLNFPLGISEPLDTHEAMFNSMLAWKY